MAGQPPLLVSFYCDSIFTTIGFLTIHCRQEDQLIVRMTNELYEKNVKIDHLDIMNNHLKGMVSTLQNQQRDLQNKNDRLRQENTALTRDIALLQVRISDIIQ
jgi:peptidoglycan hydrolase CwlO-like protein